MSLKLVLSAKDFHINGQSFAINYNLLMKNGEYYQLAELLSNRNNLHIIFAKSREKDNSSIFEKNDFCRIIDKQKSRGIPLLFYSID